MSSRRLDKENRSVVRWTTVTEVKVFSETYGYFDAIAVNISKKGMFIQTFDPLPLGSEVEVQIGKNEESVIANCIVKSHYYMNTNDKSETSSFTGMGLLFQSFKNMSDTEEEPDFYLIN